MGILDRWLTATLEGEIFRRNEMQDLAATQGFGDIRVGLWSGLLVAPFRLSAGVKLGLPTGDPAPEAGEGADDDAQTAAAVLPTGDGEYDFEPGLRLGYGFGGKGRAWPLEHYVTAGLGYWVRTGGISDAVTYSAELGTKVPVFILDRFWWVVRMTGIESFASADDIASGSGNLGGLGNGVTYTSVGAEVSVAIWGGLSASLAYETAFRARRIISGAPLRFALAWEY
jgi:hypothetical protein